MACDNRVGGGLMPANRSRQRLLLSTCLTGAALSLGGGAARAQDRAAATWQPHVEMQAEAGREHDGVTAELFAPLSQDSDTLVFATARMRYDEGFNENGSAILGVRQRVGDGLALGVNVGGDFYQSEFSSHSQSSVSMGLEAFTSAFDVRFNYRLPLA